MKKYISFLLVLMSLNFYARSQKNSGHQVILDKNKLLITPCAPAAAMADLDIGNVRARIMTGGDMWWDVDSSFAKYEIPKGSGKKSLFAGALWFGCIDAGGQVRVAAQTYRQNGNDFWPGPIDTLAISTDSLICNGFDRFWKITRNEVLNFVQNGTTTPDLLSWPGNGDNAGNQFHFLAPFYDVNGDGIYDISQGDYPYYELNNPGQGCHEALKGDQTLWWVFNDIGNVHSETNSVPIGLEVRAQAFAYDTTNSINITNSTFYQYKIINCSGVSFNNCYIAQWSNPAIGNVIDDYIGCDIGRGLAYCYNADSLDEGVNGYGVNPPAIGFDILEGPLADTLDGIDNNRNGTTDEQDESIIMSNFIYYSNFSGTPDGNPNGFSDFYKYLQSTWLNNAPLTYGSNGRDTANPICNFMFPDSSDNINFPTHGPWNQGSSGVTPTDSRLLASAGHFTMLPGEVNYITVGVPWAKADSGGQFASLQLLKEADDEIQSLFNNCFKPAAGISDISANPFQVLIAPVPFHEETTISFTNKNSESFTLTIYDIHGKNVKRIKNINGNQVRLDRASMGSGVYIIQLNDTNGRKYSQKILVE